MFRLTAASGGCKRPLPFTPASNFLSDLPLCDSRPGGTSIHTRLNILSLCSVRAKWTRNIHQFRAINTKLFPKNPLVDFVTPECFLLPNVTCKPFRQCFHTDRTHYEILGIDRDATTDDIRAAFLKKSKECHPDTNTTDPDNHRQFVLVNEAYSVLSKPQTRRNYDISLVRGLHSPSRPTSHAPNDDEYYHYPKGFYQEFSNRHEHYDKDHAKKPFYGIPGLDKVPNSSIVMACIVWMILGIILHYVAVKKSSTLHIKSLDERDVAIHEMWMKAKKEAEHYRQGRQEHQAKEQALD